MLFFYTGFYRHSSFVLSFSLIACIGYHSNRFMENSTQNNLAEVANVSNTGKDFNGTDSNMCKTEDHVSEAKNDEIENISLEVGNDIAATTEVNKVETEENKDENEPKENTIKTENLVEPEKSKDGEKTDGIARDTENPVENKNDNVKNTGVTSDEQKWPGWPGETVFRILVPHYRIGGLIGKKGDIIKKICEEAKSRVKVLDAAPGAPERAVLVSAKEEPDVSIPPAIDGLLRVHNRIIDGLAGEPLAPSKSGNPEVTRMLAGATQTGTLIGKQGANIKSIQDASNCVIRVIDDVPPFALPDDKVVEIQGDPTGMHKAVELIASHLRKYLVDRSVIQIFEIEMSRPMPQQRNIPPPPQPWGPPQVASHAGAPAGYNQNPHYMPPRSHDNYYPSHDMPDPYEKPTHHGISTFGRDVPTMGGHSSNSSQVNQTQHIQVPISFADAVIGSAGSNISYIRRSSGATITIQESKGVPGEMTVEINGTATQVQIAQQLIQNYMAQAGASAGQNTAPPDSDPYSTSYPSYASSAYPSSAYPSSAYGSAPPDSYGAPTASAPSSAAGYGGPYSSAYGAGYGY